MVFHKYFREDQLNVKQFVFGDVSSFKTIRFNVSSKNWLT